MKVTNVVVAVIAVVAMGLGGWSARRAAALDEAEATASVEGAQSEDELAELHWEVASLWRRLEYVRSTTTDAGTRTRRGLRELRRDFDDLGDVDWRLGQLENRARRVVPVGADVDHVEVLPAAGGERSRLVVAWSIGSQLLGDRKGVFVWRQDATPLTKPGLPDEWSLEYATNLESERDRVTVGTPGSWTTEPSPSGDFASIADVADVTGDGYDDVLIGEFSGGTGACGKWRVLAAVDGIFRSVFEHEACGESSVQMRTGRLRVWTSEPTVCFKGGNTRCTTHLKILQWDGAGWDVVRRRTSVMKY